MKLLTADDFREAIRQRFTAAERAGKTAVEINSGDLHLGGGHIIM